MTEGWAPRQGVVSRNEAMDAVEGIVLMRRGENPSAVLEARPEQRSRTSTRRLAGDGVKLDPFYDRTELVDTTLRTVGHNLLEGALLVTLVLFVFLLDLRAALVVGTLIPLSLLDLVHLPPPARDERQPPLDGRGGLRDHRRRRRGHRRGDPRAHGAEREAPPRPWTR